MNTLGVADNISQGRYGRKYMELGDFEKRQIVKIIAGTVKWDEWSE